MRLDLTAASFPKSSRTGRLYSERALPPAALIERFRHGLDPVAWASEKVGLVPDPWQAEMMLAPEVRILGLCGRQVGKSTGAGLIAVHKAEFIAGSKVAIIAASERQAGELFRTVRDIQDQAGIRRSRFDDNKLRCTTWNGSRIIGLPANPNTIRGLAGVDLIVFDELAFAASEVVAAVTPMIATKSRARLLFLSTPPLGGKTGIVWQIFSGAVPGWKTFTIRSNQCPRISADFLVQERALLGEHRFAIEYLCEFRDSGLSVLSVGEVERALVAPDAADLGGGWRS